MQINLHYLSGPDIDALEMTDAEIIAAVEAGLRAYDGALLVVSHDEAFLEAIGITRRLYLTGITELPTFISS